jgi:hypothetical protein
LTGGGSDGIYKYNFSFLPDRILRENLVRFSSTGIEEELVSRDEQSIKIGTLLKDQGAGVPR